MGKPKRAALYVRVSTDAQTVENQITELRQVAERRGWQVVEIYRDAGISGAKGRDQRPDLDESKDKSFRKVDCAPSSQHGDGDGTSAKRRSTTATAVTYGTA